MPTRGQRGRKSTSASLTWAGSTFPRTFSPGSNPILNSNRRPFFFQVPEHRRDFQGGTAMSIDELVGMIRDDIKKEGRVGKNAIPEQYDLLRMIQLVVCGYRRPC